MYQRFNNVTLIIILLKIPNVGDLVRKYCDKYTLAIQRVRKGREDGERNR
jgi:hypothetical protein